MMPYFAVVADSFRAATKSKVLWVACVAIWVLLALLAPSGTRETLTTDFQSMDLQNATRLKAVLADGLVNPDRSGTAIGRIAGALPAEIQTRLRRVGKGEDERIRYSELADVLTKLLDDGTWYDAEAWQDLRRSAEQELLEQRESLEPQQQRRLRRLRIVAAIPGVFSARTPTSLRPTYAGVDFPFDLPLDRRRFVTIVNQLVLPTIISWLLGFVLIFLGIVVTAPIIPGMLQPGSLHLLLSKPISRTGLLLAKFVGGCAFVLLCVAQLVIGLYLILGLRLDVWNIRLLWCIPASVLLFSVFYSVSVAAGLIFRSEVLSIGVTCCFGAVCLVTGVIGNVFDNFVTGRDVVQDIVLVGDHLVAKTSGGPIKWFDASQNRWQELIQDVKRDDLVFDPVVIDSSVNSANSDDSSMDSKPTMLTAVSRGARFNAYGFGSVDLSRFTPPSDPGGAWDYEPTVRLPAATTRIGLLGDQLMAVNTLGVSILPLRQALASDDPKGEPSDAPENREKAAAASVPNWLGKLSRMMGADEGQFRSILPERVVFAPPLGIATRDSDLWVASGLMLYRLTPESSASEPASAPRKDVGPRGTWSVAAETTLPGDASMRFSMAVSGDVLLHQRIDGTGVLLDAQTLQQIQDLELPTSASVSSVVGIGDGSFAVVLSDGTSWRFDSRGGWRSLGVKDASAVSFDPIDQQILVAHDTDSVVLLPTRPSGQVTRVRPSLDVWRTVDRWIVSPLRFIIPQTGELGDVIASSISGRSEVLMGDPSSDQTRVGRYEWFRPLVSCGGFIVVVMTMNIVFFHRRDY